MHEISRMTVEYIEAPVGVENPRPRFGWITESGQREWKQKSYRIQVACSSKGLDTPDMWDSGVRAGDEADGVVYEGEALRPGAVYAWRVTVTAETGESAQGESRFEMGLCGGFTAGWIGIRNPRPGWSVLFRKEFSVGKRLARARAYLCGLGAGELYINGEKCGDALLDPMQTDYQQRVLYVPYDITDRLVQGDNAVGVFLGDGWYHQNRVWANGAFSYGDCRMLLELHLTYRDGSQEVIVSDDSFLCDYGPVTLNNLYAGETYDARLEQEGWCRAGFDAEGWRRAIEMEPPGGELVCQLMPPIRKTRRVPPVAVYNHHKGAADQVFIFDMGENFAGFVRLHIPFSPAGTEYVLRFAEDVDALGGLLYTSTGIVSTLVLQQDRYIARGEPDGEDWEPRFTYHGFRYVEVTGLYAREVPEDFLTGYAVHTDLADAGGFSCSDERLNRLEALTRQTILSNYHGFPEDCPVRERCGWLGDAQLVSEAAMCRFDMAASYEKYMEDIRTSKEKFGRWMMIAPGNRVCHKATPLWSCAQIVIPWNMYLYYRDTALLEISYDAMKELVERYVTEDCVNFILHVGLGDWCPPGGNYHNPHRIPIETSSTAELFHMTVLMQKIAVVLGRPEDAAHFHELTENIREAFHQHYWDACTGSYGTQGADGAALAYGICPPERAADVAADAHRLLTEVCGGAMATGIWGNKVLVPAMTEAGYGDAMMTMLWNPDKTSFATMLRDGAASLWEVFEAPPDTGEVSSLNHPMQAAFTSWMYTHILGISPQEAHPGFRRFTIKPYVFGGITKAQGYRDTLYGRIAVSWRTDKRGFAMELTVPANTRADCSLPMDRLRRVTAEGESVPVETTAERAAGEAYTAFTLGSGRYVIEGDRG